MPSILSPFVELPVDLVRAILEEAASSHRQTAYNLLFVSRDVLKWIEPILYRTLEFTNLLPGSRLGQCCDARNDDSFFARTVRELSTWDPSDIACRLCTGVTHLHLESSGFVPIFPVGPTNFSFSLRGHSSLTHLIIKTAGDSRISLELPPNITHLQLCRMTGPEGQHSMFPLSLSACPFLTHLMFYWKSRSMEHVATTGIYTLYDYQFLQCVAVVLPHENDTEFWAPRQPYACFLLKRHHLLNHPVTSKDIMLADSSLRSSFEFWEHVQSFMGHGGESGSE